MNLIPDMSSFRDIDYSVRPAKAIERKMMIEAFRRLDLAWPVGNYRYIGLGSIYFSDFLLIHQNLGVRDMISLEREENHKTRFEFNRPFGCVEVKFRKKEDPLPELPWNKPSIVWLDYDGKVNSSVLADLRTTIQNVPSGSVVCVSVNAEADRPPNGTVDVDQWRLNEFSDRIGEGAVPQGTKGADLRQKPGQRKIWEVLSNALADQLVIRNGRPDVRPETLMAQQIFHFNYEDDAAMLTLGWVIYSVKDCGAASKCDFGSLPFVRSDDVSHRIFAPKLTPKEIRYFNAFLPHDNGLVACDFNTLERTTGVPSSDICRFSDVYRYYPNYAEVAL